MTDHLRFEVLVFSSMCYHFLKESQFKIKILGTFLVFVNTYSNMTFFYAGCRKRKFFFAKTTLHVFFQMKFSNGLYRSF